MKYECLRISSRYFWKRILVGKTAFPNTNSYYKATVVVAAACSNSERQKDQWKNIVQKYLWELSVFWKNKNPLGKSLFSRR